MLNVISGKTVKIPLAGFFLSQSQIRSSHKSAKKCPKGPQRGQTMRAVNHGESFWLLDDTLKKKHKYPPNGAELEDWDLTFLVNCCDDDQKKEVNELIETCCWEKNGTFFPVAQKAILGHWTTELMACLYIEHMVFVLLLILTNKNKDDDTNNGLARYFYEKKFPKLVEY